MNRHAESGPPTSEVPEPSFAERARSLVEIARTGTLATLCLRQPGYPFASVAPYGLDTAGRPTLLLSTMAMHTQHLAADARASLLVTEPDRREDLLAAARATLLGTIARVDGEDLEGVRADYLARHEAAQGWVDFDDFAFYRLAVADCYFVAGFGSMGWVTGAEYGAAEPDPLAAVAPGILEHMNEDHGDALVLYCRAFADLAADAATMTGIDRLGFQVRAQVGERVHSLRLGFPREVRSTGDARTVLVEMVRDARARVGA